MKALTIEEAPNLTFVERQRLAPIWRRLQWLERRIPEHKGDPSRDIEEVGSLRWLLEEADYPTPPRF